MKYKFEAPEQTVLDLLSIINQAPSMGNRKYGGARIVGDKIVISQATFHENGEVSANHNSIVIPFERVDEEKPEEQEYLGYR
jgi:hypothetical protein